LSAAAGRCFAFTLAAAFGVFALLALWRESAVAWRVFAVLAAVMATLGVVMPSHLGPLERAWMAFGHALGRITTPIIFTLLWWLAVVPMGWLRRTFSRSPLARDPTATTYWHERAPRDADVARRAMERQF
jgi:hypothetical protein